MSLRQASNILQDALHRMCMHLCVSVLCVCIPVYMYPMHSVCASMCTHPMCMHPMCLYPMCMYLCVCIYVCPFHVYAFLCICILCILCVCTLLPLCLPLQGALHLMCVHTVATVPTSLIAVHHSCSKSKHNVKPSCDYKASKSSAVLHTSTLGLGAAELPLLQSRAAQFSCCNISHRLSTRHVLCAGATADCGCIALAASSHSNCNGNLSGSPYKGPSVDHCPAGEGHLV